MRVEENAVTVGRGPLERKGPRGWPQRDGSAVQARRRRHRGDGRCVGNRPRPPRSRRARSEGKWRRRGRWRGRSGGRCGCGDDGGGQPVVRIIVRVLARRDSGGSSRARGRGKGREDKRRPCDSAGGSWGSQTEQGRFALDSGCAIRLPAHDRGERVGRERVVLLDGLRHALPLPLLLALLLFLLLLREPLLLARGGVDVVSHAHLFGHLTPLGLRQQPVDREGETNRKARARRTRECSR